MQHVHGSLCILHAWEEWRALKIALQPLGNGTGIKRLKKTKQNKKTSGFVGSVSLIPSKQHPTGLSRDFTERLVPRSGPLRETAVEAAVKYMSMSVNRQNCGM